MTVRSVHYGFEDSVSGLLDAIRTVNATLRLPDLLTAIVDAASALAECDSVSLYTSQEGMMRCVAVGGHAARAELLAAHTLPLADHWPPLRQMRSMLQVVHIADVGQHASWSDVLQSLPGGEQVRTWLGIPLTQQDRLLGFIGIGYYGLTAVWP